MVKKLVLGHISPHEVSKQVQMLRQLSPHGRITELLDVITDGEHPKYLVFEFAEQSLGFEVTRGPIQEPRIAVFSQDLVDAVSYLHARGVLHNDLRPSKLLIFRDKHNQQRLKLSGVSFGNSMVVASLDQAPGDRPALWYCAPELFHDPPELGAPSDVWSIGNIISQMHTGSPLFPLRSRDIQALEKCYRSFNYQESDLLPYLAWDPSDRLVLNQPANRGLRQVCLRSNTNDTLCNILGTYWNPDNHSKFSAVSRALVHLLLLCNSRSFIYPEMFSSLLLHWFFVEFTTHPKAYEFVRCFGAYCLPNGKQRSRKCEKGRLWSFLNATSSAC